MTAAVWTACPLAVHGAKKTKDKFKRSRPETRFEEGALDDRPEKVMAEMKRSTKRQMSRYITHIHARTVKAPQGGR